MELEKAICDLSEGREMNIPRTLKKKLRWIMAFPDARIKYRLMGNAVKNGAYSIEKVAETVNETPETVREYEAFVGKRIFWFWRDTRKQRVDDMIREGVHSLEEMGDSEGITREAVRHYIKITGQYDVWKESKKEISRLRKEITSIFGNIFFSELQKEDFVGRKTLEYYLSSVNKGKIKVEKVQRLFKAYEQAMKEREKLGYKKLGRKAGIGASQAKKILDRVGADSLSDYEYERHQISNETFRNAFRSKMSVGDLAYFLKVPNHVLWQHFNGLGKRRLSGRVVYRKQSRIYEAYDLGFTEDDICRLYDFWRSYVDYALKNRQRIERKIIRVLDILYPDKKHEKPY
jgi:hypothetical protein